MSEARVVNGVLAGLAVLVAVALALPAMAGDQGAAPGEGQVLDQIRQDSEAVISGRHFTYDPAGRRDPFEPLVRARKEFKGKRPKGIAGMLVSEIDLKGIFVGPDGEPLALFQGSDNRGYTLRVGDYVYDARLISIDPRRGVVVFRQQVDDPRRIKPYRDVIKRLQPIDEDEDPLAEEEGA